MVVMVVVVVVILIIFLSQLLRQVDCCISYNTAVFYSLCAVFLT